MLNLRREMNVGKPTRLTSSRLASCACSLLERSRTWPHRCQFLRLSSFSRVKQSFMVGAHLAFLMGFPGLRLSDTCQRTTPSELRRKAAGVEFLTGGKFRATDCDTSRVPGDR